jgi:serine phosphatase RsbU (regulator of sigma subunit)
MDESSREWRIEISWAASPRWATSGSSDLVDVVEQPGQEWAIIMIDVQGSGLGGRRLAGTLMRMTREYLASGLAPTTAVLASHQFLLASRQGKVGASIHVCVVNAIAGQVSIAGLGPLGIATKSDDGWCVDSFPGSGAGFDREVNVETRTFPLTSGQQLVLANDGITNRGEDLTALLGVLDADNTSFGSALQVLDCAISRDSGRPRSDMAVALIEYRPATPAGRVLHAHISVPVRLARSES